MSAQPAALDIEVGGHLVWNVFGLSWNVDTILSTLIAGGILIGLGLYMRAHLSVRKPKGVQLFFESITSWVQTSVEEGMGVKVAPFVVPLAVALFCFILFANWIALVPTGHHPEYAPPPASDANLAYALALLVIVWMHVTGIRKKGFRGYYHHLVTPYKFLFPINLIEELVRPVTLALRLFGNIFSGVIMVSLIALFPWYILWAPDILWKLFDAFIGLIQAFIFALLTMLYFSSVKPDEHSQHAETAEQVAH
jgi:F-type H+-transporting ATPase subunit a